MKNKDFFYLQYNYLQYNKIDWKNQEKTKINFYIYDYIIKNIIRHKKGNNIAVFDIGFGIGIFLKKLLQDLRRRYQTIIVEGCEPSRLNYKHFLNKNLKGVRRDITLKTHNKTFLKSLTEAKFDFITAIYVFPHFAFDDTRKVARKIRLMLKEGGKFVLVVANEKYLENKLKTEQDLFIESRNIALGGKKYREVLHYSDIPKIGKVIDYNRDESFYIDLFKKNGFALNQKKNINDAGFICTLFVFKKRLHPTFPKKRILNQLPPASRARRLSRLFFGRPRV